MKYIIIEIFNGKINTVARNFEERCKVIIADFDSDGINENIIQATDLMGYEDDAIIEQSDAVYIKDCDKHYLKQIGE